MKIKINYFAAMLLAMFAGGGIGAQGAEQPKKATSHTIEYNQKFLGAPWPGRERQARLSGC
ncbi:hypothetical protein [Akkermansia sp.]|uniref:hypothetical protein n=1 Tax=Akkermansia sp. TaxID=1872421 RepID=UPI003AB0C285